MEVEQDNEDDDTEYDDDDGDKSFSHIEQVE